MVDNTGLVYWSRVFLFCAISIFISFYHIQSTILYQTSNPVDIYSKLVHLRHNTFFNDYLYHNYYQLVLLGDEIWDIVALNTHKYLVLNSNR